MKKLRLFFSTIAVFVTVFAFSCIPSFAADNVTFDPSWVSPTWNYYPDNIQYVSDGSIYHKNKTSGDYTLTDDRYAYVYYSGTLVTYSENVMPGGYSYSGTLGVNCSATIKPPVCTLLNGSQPEVTHSYCQLDYVEFIIDNQSFYPFISRRGLDRITAYLTLKDNFVSASSRVEVVFHLKGYVVLDLGRANSTGVINRVYVPCSADVVDVNPSYVLHGTTSGFKDNLTNFDNSMNEGSQKEDNLTNKAIGDVNSFEFKDIKDDSSILSSLTFYSSVINLAYGSLGGTIQTLIAISFGVLIVIFILRIRRDSS